MLVGSLTDAELGFSDIERIAVDHEGLVYVLEGAAREVRIFSPDGEPLRVIGGRGQGPGEFELQIAGWMGLVGDTLWVSDPRASRVTFFRRNGELLGTISPRPVVAFEQGEYNATLLPGVFRRDGLITSTSMVGVPPAVRRPNDVTVQVPTVRLDASGTIVDTIRVLPLVMRAAAKRVPLEGRQLIVPSAPDTVPLRVPDAESNHIFVVERPVAPSPAGAVFTVTKVAGAADTLWHRQLRYRPEAFTTEAIRTLLEPAVASHVAAVRRERAEADSGSTAAAAEAALRGALALPQLAPPVSLARVGEDGVLWLRLEDRGEPFFRWVMIDGDGRLIGQVDIPRNVTVHWSSGDTVWASRLDELDVPWLVRYRLAESG